MPPITHITNVAIVGAGGNAGSFMTNALLKTGKHVVTAITRSDSQSKLPEGVIIKHVDYSDPSTLVDALRGQDALVITISGQAPIHEVEEKLVRAAGEAGVPWIMPNEWSPDSTHEGILNDAPMFGMKVATRKLIEEVGKSSYIGLSTGFWYEWSLAIAPAYGFDFANRSITFFDDGRTKISTSTWPQVGRAVAALLSLPVNSAGSNADLALEDLRNKVVYICSFTVSQRDMLESVLRVTGTKEDDWTITSEPIKDRFLQGVEGVKQGRRSDLAKVMYGRIFFPDGCGDFEHSKGTLNRSLGLPEEDIDTATKIAIERSKSPVWG